MMSVGPLPVQVFLIAPPLVGWGLERLVHTAMPRLELVGTSASLVESLSLLERNLPDVVVLDLDDGYTVEAVAQLYERTRVKVLVLTSSTDTMMLDRLVTVGARGVLKKREAPAALLKAIEKIADGEMWVDQASSERIFMDMARRRSDGHDTERSKIAALTLRERQTIVAVASDSSAPAKVIAGRLCISEHTLRNHLTSIYAKLGLSSRLDLYAYATKHQLNRPLEN